MQPTVDIQGSWIKSLGEFRSISTKLVCVDRSVYSVQALRWSEVAQVLSFLWSEVIVIVSPLTVVTVAVEVLDPEVQALGKNF